MLQWALHQIVLPVLLLGKLIATNLPLVPIQTDFKNYKNFRMSKYHWVAISKLTP